MRISAGELRGRRLKVLPGIRPTGARQREALFSIWAPKLVGARFLELFAGTGAVGFEALSRGAAEVFFAELSPGAVRALEENGRLLASGRTRVRRLRLPGDLARHPPDLFDLAFADPPYDFRAHLELLELAAAWVAPGGELALEHSRRLEPPETAPGWLLAERRSYGESRLTFYRRTGPESGADSR